MVMTSKRFRRVVLQMSVAAFVSASIGAAVAAPFVMGHKVHVAKTQIGELAPLASGPAIQLAKAGPGLSEDCVRVTRMIGPDGKEYPTNGIVCSEK